MEISKPKERYFEDSKHGFQGFLPFSKPVDVVNGFANHFSTTYLADSAMDLSDLTNNILPLNFVSVEEQQLINIMAKFSNKFTAGDDLIPSFLIRGCRYVLTKPLSIIFNAAIESSFFPSVWKRAKICPILNVF